VAEDEIMTPAYVLVTPARNEEQYVETTMQCVIAQTVQPVRWVIVSDGSTDRTDEIVGGYAAKHDWIQLVKRPRQAHRNFASMVKAFNSGYQNAKSVRHNIVGKLDADFAFESDYFEYLLNKFSEDPRLGIAGTPFVEEGCDSQKAGVFDKEHVYGGCQLFRKECFEDIGGYPVVRACSSVVANTTARMRGWKTQCYTDMMCRHLRRLSTAEQGLCAAKFEYGWKDYYLGNHPLWEVFRSIYQMKNAPRVLGGLILLSGYVWSYVKREKRDLPEELIQFRRTEQVRRLKSMIRRILHNRDFYPRESEA
jgi:glycosyltransferase involved in cell wall biosynthesis